MAKRRKSKKGKPWVLIAALLVAAGGAIVWFYPKISSSSWEQVSNWKTNLPSLPRIGSTTNVPSPQPSRPSPHPVQTPNPILSPVRTNATAPPQQTLVPVQPPETITPALPSAEPAGPPRPVQNVLEAQIALARLGISAGTMDGVPGNNLRRALLSYQIHNNLAVSGELDEETKQVLMVEEPLFEWRAVTSEDLARIVTVPSTWLGKSEVERLGYESVLEMFAEQSRSSLTLIRSLNPQVNWANLPVGTPVKIPRVEPPSIREKAAFIRIHLYSKTLVAFGKNTNLLAHFPCSIAAKVDKRPVGRLSVAKIAENPNYLFDPAVFSESEEARQIGRKLMIPPGPNNPVGTAWIGLDKPGYGIHGTPKPEQIGRTESHGCFRLANWNAEHLLQLVWVGMPVFVEP